MITCHGYNNTDPTGRLEKVGLRDFGDLGERFQVGNFIKRIRLSVRVGGAHLLRDRYTIRERCVLVVKRGKNLFSGLRGAVRIKRNGSEGNGGAR